MTELETMKEIVRLRKEVVELHDRVGMLERRPPTPGIPYPVFVPPIDNVPPPWWIPPIRWTPTIPFNPTPFWSEPTTMITVGDNQLPPAITVTSGGF